ncbi:MAG: DeoR family transcriptional regulator [Methanospirillum sp.]|uniref:ATP-binding protein n=1 Tax=Methanospirillum sp. TaxID=45200 RepID=UPI00236C53D0|nr:ATP-binding protein [Methanospirillum sp.]MDD1727804.1 DeoR family transcriptional regulator [Methanospirillum sp.]
MKILNPGSLPPELSIESLKTEHLSLPKNVHIAQTLFLGGYIEQWGSGTNHMIESCQAQNLPEPEFEATGHSFSVTFRRVTLFEYIEEKITLNVRQKQVIEYLISNTRISTADYALMYNCTLKTAQRDLAELVSADVLKKSGKTRGVYYTLKDSIRTLPMSQ